MDSVQNYCTEGPHSLGAGRAGAELNFLEITKNPDQQAHCINRQQRPFQDAAELTHGLAVGTINTTEGFIEFLATPDSVSHALMGIGPVLDNAVNYYGGHIAHATIAQIGKDATEAAQYAEQWLANYSHQPPEKRGEVIAALGGNFLAGELMAAMTGPRFAMSASEQLESKVPTIERLKSGAGGEWKVLNERPSADVVKQTEWDSCAAACAEMLSEGKISQADAFAHLKDGGLDAPGVDAKGIPELLGPEWLSHRVTSDSIKVILRRGQFAAELKDWTVPGRTRTAMGHMVVIDGVDEEGLFRIRDPQHGTRYEMMPDEFFRVWTGLAVFRY